MHNLELSEEQRLILDTVARFVDERARPVALDHDEHRRFVEDGFAALAELGLLAIPVSEEAGGAGMGMLAFAVAVEELAKGCSSTARILVSQAGLCGKVLEGIPDGAALLERILSGEALAAYVGPDARIVARFEGSGVVLDGQAPVVTAAARAEVFLVLARTAEGELVLCTFDSAALDAGLERAPTPASGFHATAPGSVRLTSHVVPAECILVRGPAATAAAERATLAALIGGAALAVGIGEHAFTVSRRHTHDRIAFGKPLFAQQAVAHKLADARRRIQAARHLVYHAARLCDLGQDAMEAAVTARLAAVEAAVVAADEAIQVHGGFGYTVEYLVERHYRDAQSLLVLDVPQEILHDELAARLRL